MNLSWLLVLLSVEGEVPAGSQQHEMYTCSKQSVSIGSRAVSAIESSQNMCLSASFPSIPQVVLASCFRSSGLEDLSSNGILETKQAPSAEEEHQCQCIHRNDTDGTQMKICVITSICYLMRRCQDYIEILNVILALQLHDAVSQCLLALVRC